MVLADELVALLEIQALTTRFWHDVDYNWGNGAAEYFVEDGIFELGTNRFVGRDAIRAFYRWREGRGARVARHVITNMHVTLSDAARAQSVWIMSLYAADGVPPLPSEPSIAMADVIDHCVRRSNGQWRY